MTLMHGSPIFADATLVRDCGIATGAMLTVIRTAPHKILVARDNVAELWNHEGRLDGVLCGHEHCINEVQFSPDTNLAITCSFDSTAKLWGVGSQECLFTLKHERMVVTGAFSTTGTTVVTTMFSHELKQWCVRSGDCISTLRLSHKGAFDFAFIAQGVHVLHTVEDCITLWNTETGTRVWEHHVGFPLWYMSRICLSR
jgi:WD40 repeat protein